MVAPPCGVTAAVRVTVSPTAKAVPLLVRVISGAGFCTVRVKLVLALTSSGLGTVLVALMTRL